MRRLVRMGAAGMAVYRVAGVLLALATAYAVRSNAPLMLAAIGAAAANLVWMIGALGVRRWTQPKDA